MKIEFIKKEKNTKSSIDQEHLKKLKKEEKKEKGLFKKGEKKKTERKLVK